MKRNFWKSIKNSEKKLALCLMIAGLSAFSVGFTNQNESVEVEKIKTIEEVQVEVPEVAGNEAIVPTADFINTTSESVENPPKEDVIEPLKVIGNVEELNHDDNENVSIENDINTESAGYNVTENGMNYRAVMAMEATAYLPTDGSAEGLTAMGIPATYGVVAVDPDVIPLGSRVYIPGYGEAIAADTGGAIIGYCIDLCMESYDACMDFGRRTVTVYVLD
ncbi:MAG: 3D domain-containing protein [Selenomonadaceae bacterium]|nr:3D domain-containing protein [Selenomonadaceae bacterium]